MQKHYKPLLYLGIGMSIFLLFVFISELVTISDKLSAIHVGLAWAFYVLVVLFLFFFFIRPLVLILGRPPLNLKELMQENPDPKKMKRAIRLMSKKGNLSKEEHALMLKSAEDHAEIDAQMRVMVQARMEGIEKDIWRYSKSVFVTTAISQLGKLDAFFLIVNNFQMLKDIFNRFPYRPSFYHMWRIYFRVLILSFGALSIEEMSDRSIIEEIFPRLHPLGGRTVTSIVQGVTYAFITYRIGLFAKEFFMVPNAQLSREKRDEIRKTAFKKSMEIATSLVTDIPVNIVKKLLKPFR